MKASWAILFILFLLVSCEDQGDFEPNNLISVEEDAKAERERALLTGNPYFETITLNSPKVFDVGEKIIINARFQKRVRITNGGIPRIPINIGGVIRYADYVSGSESQSYTFRFEYTVQAGDLDHNGISLQSPWELNGADIEDYAEKPATLTYSVPSTPDHQVDTANLAASFSDSYTNAASSTLDHTATNASELYIGTSCLGGGASIAYATSSSVNIFTNNATNTYYIAAGNGSGGYSQCVTASIVHDNQNPNAVSGVTLGNDASDIESDNTSWNTASDNGPAGIAYYEIAVSTSNGVGGIIAPEGNWTNVGSTPTGSISNGSTPWLAGATNYYTLIRAVDRAGNRSNVVASSAWTRVALSPEQITSLSLVEASNDSIRIGWPYPDDNGFPITNYVIQYKLNSESSWTTVNDYSFPTRRYTLSGLTAETEYDFRVRAYNGTNYGAWSPILETETLPNIDFVTYDYVAINIGGAVQNALVSMEDGNEIRYGNNSASTYNDDSLISASLDRGKTISVDANDFTVVVATKPFFIAGTRWIGNQDTQKANVVWATKSWIGKSFVFNINRDTPMELKIYAFTNTDLVVTRNGTPITGGTLNGLTAESGHSFSLNNTGSYEISSTGFIVAYTYATRNGSRLSDPKPVLPASNDLIDVPSQSGKISTATPNTTIDVYYSNNTTATETITSIQNVADIDRRGTSRYYQEHSTRLRATAPIAGNSYADQNGNCSAPFAPVAFPKTKFAINVQAEWVAMASTNEVTVTAYEPNAAGNGWETPKTYNLTRSGSNNNTPTKGYETARNFRAGTIFEGDAPFQMWYEPRGDTHATTDIPGGQRNAADNDETILFGWD